MCIKKSKNGSDCSLGPVRLIQSQHQIHRRLGGKGLSKSLCLTAPFTVKDTETQRETTLTMVT